MKSITTLIQTFHDRYPIIGPSFWLLSIQYYMTQLSSSSHKKYSNLTIYYNCNACIKSV